MSQTSYFKSLSDPATLGELEGETGNLGKRLELRDRDETWWDKRFNTEQEETSETLYLQVYLYNNCLKTKNSKIDNSSTESNFRFRARHKCHMSSWLLFFV